MSLRIPAILAIITSLGAFLCIDKDRADAVAPAPGMGDAVPAPTAPLAWSAPVPAGPAHEWLSVVAAPDPGQGLPSPDRQESVTAPPKIRLASEVVSTHPPVRVIHPSLIGALSSPAARAMTARAGDRNETRRVAARPGDAVPLRYGDTLPRH